MSPPQLPRRSLQHALRTALRETCFGCLLPFPSILYHTVFQIARGFVHFFKKIFEGCTCRGKSGNVYPRKILDRPAQDPPPRKSDGVRKARPEKRCDQRENVKKECHRNRFAATLLWGTAYSVTSGPGSGTVACARNPEGRRIRRSMALFMRLPLRYPAA